jgi:uncharacterized protein
MTNDPAIVRLLLAHGANPSLKGARMTPLMTAAMRGNIETPKLLLDAGADPNEHAPDTPSPLRIAEMWHRGDVARLLRERGAIEPARQDGNTTKPVLSS